MVIEFTDSLSFLVWKWGHWLGKELFTMDWELLAGLESWSSKLFGISLAEQRASSPGRLTFCNRCLQRMFNLLKNDHHHSFAVTRPLTWLKSQHALRQRLANVLKDQRINIFSFADHIGSVTTTELCYCSATAHRDNMRKNGHGWVLIQPDLQTQEVDWTGCMGSPLTQRKES